VSTISIKRELLRNQPLPPAPPHHVLNAIGVDRAASTIITPCHVIHALPLRPIVRTAGMITILRGSQCAQSALPECTMTPIWSSASLAPPRAQAAPAAGVITTSLQMLPDFTATNALPVSPNPRTTVTFVYAQ